MRRVADCLGVQANVLTGAVNLSMKTMYVSDARALAVLSVYSLVVCGVPWVLEGRRKGKMKTRV